MTELPVFKSANEFSLHIEKLAAEKKQTHLEAILEYCADHMLEPADISSKVNKSLKAKIEQNFRDLNYLPKQAQLDV
jgi:hypothetical protein